MFWSVVPEFWKKMNSYLLSFIIVFIISNLVDLNSVAFAQDDDSMTSYSKAAVYFDGYNLFFIRGTSSYPAAQRANSISDRIKLIADQPALSPDSIRVVHSDVYDEIGLGAVMIMRIFDSDAKLEGVSREALSISISRRITEAIYSYRFERTSESLIKRSLFSLAALILSLIILVIVNFLIKKLNIILEQKLKARFEKIESKSFQLIRSTQIWITISGFIRVMKIIISILIIFFTAQYILGLFPWTRFISMSLIELFTKPFSDFGVALITFVPNLAFLLVTFFITKYVLKLIKLLFLGLGERNISISGFDPDWAVPTYKIVRIFLIAFAVVIAYPYIPGSDSAAFKGVSVFLGLLISLGSSSVIGNIVAGYSMTYRKPFKIGDIVQIDGNLGRVAEIKLFITKLHTIKNEEIIIPNSTVLNTNVINFSNQAQEKGLILYTSVGIGYETPWRLVDSMLKLAANRTQGVLKEPEPFVLQKALGDFSVTYELNVYTRDPLNRMKIYTELHQNILDVFNENNVQIMTPAYEGDPERPKIVPKEKWFEPVAGEKIPDKNIADKQMTEDIESA